MSVNLKITLGTVNYTDWLHVTACKVSAPTVVVWEDWIDVPVSNYNFIIPNLDPENYYVRYYDAPTNVALGTLVAELVVNALTSEFIYERRFYTTGGPGAYDPANGATSITDPYLINKNVVGTFKEGFRPFQPTVEYTFDSVTGILAVVNGTSFSTDEVFVVDIQYAAGTISSSSSGGLYAGTLDVTTATKTLLATDRNKRIRCVGMIATQVITVCPLSLLNLEDGFYFDNACGGTAVQVKILLDGGDRIKYNGFMAASDLFDEFWVSKGEHLLIRKFDDAYFEVITDYKGIEVGNRMTGGYVGMPAWKAEDGSLSDGDEYGRVWWWINTILPGTHIITDDAVTDLSYAHPANAIGQFVKHSTLKKFRWPNTQNVSERGLADFNTYGADVANRPVDYPGGFQAEMIKDHAHSLSIQLGDDNNGNYFDNSDDSTNQGTWTGQTGNIVSGGGPEQRIKNIGIIYMRHI